MKIKQIVFKIVTQSLFFSVALFSCSKQIEHQSVLRAGSENQIIGGENADIIFQKKNGVVGLLIVSEKLDSAGAKTQAQAICTGSLISKRTILTAAHCVFSKSTVAVAAVFEPDMKAAFAQKKYIKATGWKFNPDFKPNSVGGKVYSDGNSWNDVAVIYLSSDAPVDSELSKMPTRADADQVLALKPVTLAGYGITTPLVNEVQIIGGQNTIVPIKGISETAGILRFVNDITVINATSDDKEILLDQKNGTQGACHGDSGGPAYVTGADGSLVLIGITSRGTDLNGNCDQQNVFTNVFGYMDWIQKNISM